MNIILEKIKRLFKKIEYYKYLSLKDTKYEKELKKWYYKLTKEKLDFNNLETFNQKIQWLKIHDNNPLREILCDKYSSRKWLEENIGEEYLVPLIGVWDRFDDIDFNLLPQKFVLKCNHGCAYNCIVENKKDIEPKNLKRKFNKWLKENYAFKNGFELQYKNIKPKIICEEHLGENFVDCQFWCFNGNIEFISYIKSPHLNNEKISYDIKWNKLNFVTSNPILKEEVKKPTKFNKMKEIAELISKNFKFVRVDFYILENEDIKISEITFTPASGVVGWNPKETNNILGKKLDLNSGDKNEQKI